MGTCGGVQSGLKENGENQREDSTALREEMEALKKETLTLRKEMDTLRKTMPDNKLLWAPKVKRPWKVKVEKPNFRTEKLAETLRDSFEATQGVKDDDPQKNKEGISKEGTPKKDARSTDQTPQQVEDERQESFTVILEALMACMYDVKDSEMLLLKPASQYTILDRKIFQTCLLGDLGRLGHLEAERFLDEPTEQAFRDMKATLDHMIRRLGDVEDSRGTGQTPQQVANGAVKSPPSVIEEYLRRNAKAILDDAKILGKDKKASDESLQISLDQMRSSSAAMSQFESVMGPRRSLDELSESVLHGMQGATDHHFNQLEAVVHWRQKAKAARLKQKTEAVRLQHAPVIARLKREAQDARLKQDAEAAAEVAKLKQKTEAVRLQHALVIAWLKQQVEDWFMASKVEEMLALGPEVKAKFEEILRDKGEMEDHLIRLRLGGRLGGLDRPAANQLAEAELRAEIEGLGTLATEGKKMLQRIEDAREAGGTAAAAEGGPSTA